MERLSTRKGTKLAKVCLPERVHLAIEKRAKERDVSVNMYLSQLVTQAIEPDRERKQPA